MCACVCVCMWYTYEKYTLGSCLKVRFFTWNRRNQFFSDSGVRVLVWRSREKNWRRKTEKINLKSESEFDLNAFFRRLSLGTKYIVVDNQIIFIRLWSGRLGRENSRARGPRLVKHTAIIRYCFVENQCYAFTRKRLYYIFMAVWCKNNFPAHNICIIFVFSFPWQCQLIYKWLHKSVSRTSKWSIFPPYYSVLF